jgi:hypothetical protein
MRHANVVNINPARTLRNILTGVYVKAVWRAGRWVTVRDKIDLGGGERDQAPLDYELKEGPIPKSAPRKEPSRRVSLNLRLSEIAIMERMAGGNLSEWVGQLIREAGAK